MAAEKNWNEFYHDVSQLWKVMGDYRPHIIVPLLRGGAAPMVPLAEWLHVMDVRPMNIEREEGGRRIVYPPGGNVGNVAGLDVLILEDDVPTGGSILYAKRVLEDQGAKVKIAAVYVHSKSARLVDFYGMVSDPLPSLPWKPSREGDRIVGMS